MADHSSSHPHIGRGFTLHPRQCVSCEDESPSCNCAADENCVLTSRTCSQCPTIQCNKKPGAGGGGVNPGVIAGPVVAILVIASLVLFWYLRRKKRRDLARLEELAARARKAEMAGFHLSQPGSPSPGSARSLPSARSQPRSSRQSGLGQQEPLSANSKRRSTRSPLPPAQMNAEYYDEHGGHIRVYGGNGHINADPNHPDNGGSDPFSDTGDNGSFSTRGSGTTGASTNIIPIQYIPPSGSEGDLEETARGGRARPKSQAARTLNEARENLFKGGPPQRPARAPGLDLRLNGTTLAAAAVGVEDESEDRSPSGSSGAGRVRDSYLSGTSGAPSYSSGYTTDLHTDAPKIFTSKHVQLGRFQQAEMVSFGNQQQQYPTKPISPSADSTSPPSNSRTLTPTGRRYDDPNSALEEMPSPDPNHHPAQTPSPTDLRFSMGSLAYRDSISSMGTERYLARPDSSFGPAVRPPRAPWATGERASVMSGMSEADSVLGSYPMIPPNSSERGIHGSTIGFPQSSSTSSLDHNHFQPRPDIHYSPSTPQTTVPPSIPPPSYRPTPNPRPQTSGSMADSILGGFPFVPPNNEDLAELPSARIPDTAGKTGVPVNRTARNTAMSGVSEGLGGFEFRFEDGSEDVPPVPSYDGHGQRRGSG